MANETNHTVQPPVADTEQQSGRRPVSEAQMNANRQNAQRSTGATSDAGRAASSMNALTHGFCSMKALLPGDSAQAYADLVASHFARNSPQTDEESELVQFIADNTWRLLKVPAEEQAAIEDARYTYGSLETGLYGLEKDPVRRAAMLEGGYSLVREKQLRNIRLHERRLRKQIADDTTKLKEIQKERIERPAREAKEAKDENYRQVDRIIKIAKRAAEQNVPFVPSEFGFDLSVSEFEEFRKIQQTRYNLCDEVLDMQTVIARVKRA